MDPLIKILIEASVRIGMEIIQFRDDFAQRNL